MKVQGVKKLMLYPAFYHYQTNHCQNLARGDGRQHQAHQPPKSQPVWRKTMNHVDNPTSLAAASVAEAAAPRPRGNVLRATLQKGETAFQATNGESSFSHLQFVCRDLSVSIGCLSGKRSLAQGAALSAWRCSRLHRSKCHPQSPLHSQTMLPA